MRCSRTRQSRTLPRRSERQVRLVPSARAVVWMPAPELRPIATRRQYGGSDARWGSHRSPREVPGPAFLIIRTYEVQGGLIDGLRFL